MSKYMRIQNVRVMVDEYSCSIHWDDEHEYRYHVHTSLELPLEPNMDGKITPIIYKNAPMGINHRDGFRTRRLDLSTKANTKIWHEVLTLVKRDDLVNKAIEQYNSDKNARQEQHKLDLKTKLQELAGPRLYEALSNILANAKLVPDPWTLAHCYSVTLDDIEAARKALNFADNGIW